MIDTTNITNVWVPVHRDDLAVYKKEAKKFKMSLKLYLSLRLKENSEEAITKAGLESLEQKAAILDQMKALKEQLKAL